MQTLEQFGQTIKTKYPQYADLTDAELGTKMLSKYPQYSDMVSNQSTQNQQPTKKPGLVSKVVGALTKSEQHLGQDIGRGLIGSKTFGLGTGQSGDEFQQGLVNQYEDNSKRLATLAAKQTDPTLKKKYLDMSKSMFDDGVRVGEDFKGRTWEQIAGDVAGVGLDVGLTLSGLGAGKALKGASTAQKVIAGTKTGAKIGTAYGLAGGLQENKDALGVVGSGAVGGLTGSIVGGGVAYAGAKIGQGLDKIARNRSVEGVTEKADDLAGLITQGEKGEKSISRKVLSNIDVSDVKSQDDLLNVLNKRVENLSSKQDDFLTKNAKNFKVKDLNMPIGNGDVKHNFVDDAIEQIRKFYEATNNYEGLDDINKLSSKIKKGGGITIKEVNDLARTHGQKLNAFNANGELASGLGKQAAENTRKGLKTTVRELFGGKKSALIDKEISNTIKVRDLVAIQAEAVNKLQQKIQQRGLGEKVGYYMGKVINVLGLGSPKGLVQSMIPRGQGYKVLNAIDIERMLSKNLNKIQALDRVVASGSEQLIIKKIQELFGSEVTKAITGIGIGKIGDVIANQK